jgi:O-antigen ligase
MTPLATTSAVETILHPAPSGRLLTWTGAWHTFQSHPFFGQGLESEVAHVHYLTASGALQTLTDAHNTWLSIMAQQGLVGIVAFSWVVIHLVRRFRLSGPPVDREAAVRASLELAMIGGFLYSTLTGSFENTRHVWALMGLVAAVQTFPAMASALTAD